MITLICPVKRRHPLSPEEFHRHWRDVHARLIADTPALARHLLSYTQHPAAPAEDLDGREPEWDGVAIAQYSSRKDMEALFAEPEYHTLLRPDEEYLTDPAQVRWILCENIHRVLG